MNVSRMLGASLLALSALAVGCDDDDDPVTVEIPTQFTATLDDGNERPAITTTTNASGRATFTVNDNGSISYAVFASNTTSRVTVCHIHAGASDANGPVLVTLCPAGGTTAAVTTETQIASGTITKGNDASTVGSSPIKLAALLKMLVDGDAYVNVHTANNGGGEIRGQVTPVP